MHLKKYYFLFIWISLLVLSGCQIDDWHREDDKIPVNGFKLNYTVDSPATRATIPSTPEENSIKSLYILFFEPSQNGTGQFIDIYTVPVEGEIINGQFHSIYIDFTDPKYSDLEASKDYKLFIAANAEIYSRAISYEGEQSDIEALRRYFKTVLQERTENEVLNETFFRIQYDQDGKEGTITESLPMSGSINKSKEEKEVEVILTRNVCRIDVFNNDSRYQLVHAWIWNVFPRTNIWGSRFQEYGTEERINSATPFTPKAKVNENDPDELENKIEGQMYTFENYVAEPVQNDEITTCVMVEMLNLETKNREFFRINVTPPGGGQQLKRNYIYKVNINKVSGTGSGSIDDAYTDSELRISGNVNDWNMDESGSVLIDGDNIMVIPYTKVNFLPKGGEFKSTIFTFGEGTLEISNQFLPDNITATLRKNELTITARDSKYEQQGMVELSFGNLKGTITITQRGNDTEFLEVTPEQLENFPANPVNGNKSETIRVTATGISMEEGDDGDAWIASIVSNGVFSFQKEGEVVDILTSEKATNNEFNIYLKEENKGNGPVYGFVMVALKNNPKVSRVIILTQDPTGGFTLSEDGPFTFSPSGETEQYTRRYSVDVNTGENWNVRKVSGSGEFTVKRDETNRLIIETSQANTTGSEFKSVYRVYLTDKPSTYQEFAVIQKPHTITFDPDGNFPVVSYIGDKTIDVRVISTAPWKAEILQYHGNIPHFAGKTTPTDLVSGNPGDSFAVEFPELHDYSAHPTATVKISIVGTDVSRTLIFRQEALPVRNINFHGWGTYGNLARPGNATYNINHIKQMSDNIRNPRYFGHGGTMDVPPYLFEHHTGTDVSEKADIFQTSFSSINATHAQNIANWKNKAGKNRVYFYCDDSGTSNTSIDRLMDAGVISRGYVVRTRNIVAANKRKLCDKPEFTSTYMYQYLIKEGPFTDTEGEIDPGKIMLISSDGVNSCLTAWPDTFIPIIMSEDGQNCIFGIDPTYRFMYLGDIDIFGNRNNSSANYAGSDQAPHNMKLLNNILAWMTNAAMYGDKFIGNFK